MYQHPNYSAALAFVNAHMFKYLTPLGVLYIIFKDLQLFHISVDTFMLTNDSCLSSPLSPVLNGPTPTDFILYGVSFAQLQELLLLPVDV